jgi:hypothetical protein
MLSGGWGKLNFIGSLKRHRYEVCGRQYLTHFPRKQTQLPILTPRKKARKALKNSQKSQNVRKKKIHFLKTFPTKSGSNFYRF